jgi:hypothetical protein
MTPLEKLRRWQAIAERHRSQTADVDAVALREAADEIERLRGDLSALQETLTGVKSMHADALEESERLTAIVDRLPKTADGVPMTLGQTVYTLRSDGVVRGRQVIEITGDWIGVQVGALVGTRGSARPEIIYSTREAAEKARTE